MKLEQAARQALEALELHCPNFMPLVRTNTDDVRDKAITALREALAEQAEQDLDTCPGCGGVADNGHDREFPPNPYYCTNCTEQAEQEPVAWAYIDADGSFMDALDRQHGAYQTPLYAAPVRTKDLTDDEINNVMAPNMSLFEFARAVIAADRRKNGAA